MAGAKATFTAELQDQMSGPSKAAASGLEKLKSAMQAQQAELRALTSAHKVMNQGTVVNVTEHKRLADRIQTVKNSLAQNQSQYLKAGGSLTELTKKTAAVGKTSSETKTHTNELVKSLDKWGVTSDKASTSQNLAALGAAGMAAAIVAVEAAVVAGTIALVSFAIRAADAARTAHLMMVGFAGGADNADALGMQIDQLSRKLPQTRAELRRIAQALAGEGMQGNALVDSTKAIATISAAMGSGAASKLQAIISRAQIARRFIIGAFDLRGAGISIDDIAAKLSQQMNVSAQVARQALMTGGVAVADGLKAVNAALDAKFGTTVAALSRSLPTLKAKAEEALGQLFNGVDIEPLLKGLASMERMLEGNTTTGKALKLILSDLVQPIINGLVRLGPVAKDVFIGFLAGVIMIDTAVIRLRTKLKQLIPPELRPNLNDTGSAMKVGTIAALALAGGLAAVAVAGALCVAVMLLPFVIFGAAVYGVIKLIEKAIGALRAKFDDLLKMLRATVPGFEDVGRQMTAGLANGISSGGDKVSGAVHSVADDAIAGFNKKFKIHSPSVVMRDLGVFLPMGLAQGIEDGSPQVQRATTEMLVVPSEQSAASAGKAAAGPGAARAAPTVHIAKLEIVGVKGADDPSFEQKLVDVLRVALSGAGVPVEA